MMSFSVLKQGYIVTFKMVTKNMFTNLEKANSLNNHRPIYAYQWNERFWYIFQTRKIIVYVAYIWLSMSYNMYTAVGKTLFDWVAEIY